MTNLSVGFIAFLALSNAALAENVTSSPNGRLAISISDNATSYTIKSDKETIIFPSDLGIEFFKGKQFENLVLEATEDLKEDSEISLIATKASTARNTYVGKTLTFKEPGSGRHLYLDTRAYNDGVAFRYRLDPGQQISLASERTTFKLQDTAECLVSEYSGAHEVPFYPTTIAGLNSTKHYDMPVVCTSSSKKTSFAITQSQLKGYTGASLRKQDSSLRVEISAVPGRTQDAAYRSDNGLTTAWRVIMVADSAGKLIESNIIGNLNPSPTGDFSWVKPGKAVWDWWSNPVAGMKPSMDEYRRFIDFAAENGFEYYLIDAGWAWGSGPDCWIALPQTDITKPADGIDMLELVKYAAKKGVGILLWAHWEHVQARMDKVLDTYAAWGVKGIKVDFMNRDDQEMVNFYYRLADATASRHLLLDLHSAYPPAGLQRTYPNFITQEGVLGAEWNKLNKDVTPVHNLMLPFTRMLVGPMDYTPGGFRNATPSTYELRPSLPQTQTTRGQALAMYVVYESPLQMVSDDPGAYRGEPGFEFIRRVPASWDETRFLQGAPGKYIAITRRKGQLWYLGAMSGDNSKKLDISLSFLPKGKYKAILWQDGELPREVKRTTEIVINQQVLKLDIAAAGGAAVILEPLN